MNPENAIEIRNMSKSFKIQYDKAHALKELLVIRNRSKAERHEVLNNINLDIKKGETVALVGTNGCGKSTLLKLMTKIIYPTSGKISTSGKLSSLLELGAGFHPDFTGRENIYFNAAIFGLSKEEIQNRVDDIIEFSELGGFIDEPIRTYSSGMYMRLAFSVAINVDADILLIDEILAVGDQHFQDKCFAKLRELRDGERTIVIVTHSLDVVKDLCNRAVWICDGTFRLDGDPTYVIDEYLKEITKRSALQYQNDVKKEKQGIAEGIIYIDQPNDNMHLNSKLPMETIRGWKLCTDNEASFILKVGEHEIKNIVYGARPDVIEAYIDSYGTAVEPSTVGWNAIINFSEHLSELKNGGFTISAILKTKDNQTIFIKQIRICWDERGWN